MQEKDSAAMKGVLRSRQGLPFFYLFFLEEASFAFVCFHGRAYIYICSFKAVTFRFRYAEAVVTGAARA